jgi:hypothetical protein
MCNYVCHNCGDESSDEPEVTLIFTKKVLTEHPTKDYPAYLHGWYYKPTDVADEEWGNRFAQERKEYFAERYEILMTKSYDFCSKSCASNYLLSEELKRDDTPFIRS